jgi:hypothetical protein
MDQAVDELRIMTEVLQQLQVEIDKTAAELDPMAADLDKMAKSYADILVGLTADLQIQKDIIAQQRIVSRLRNNDPQAIQNAVDKLLQVKDVLGQIAKHDKLAPGQIEQIDKMLEQIDRVTKKTDQWSAAILKIPIAAKAKELMTLSGQIGLLVNMYAEATRQASLWSEQNYALYGSVEDIANMVHRVQSGTVMLQKDAEKATQAMAGVAMDPANIEKGAKAIGDFSVRSGVAADVAAEYAKQMEVVTGNIDGLGESLRNIRAYQQQFGMDGKAAGAMMQSLSKNVFDVYSRRRRFWKSI